MSEFKSCTGSRVKNEIPTTKIIFQHKKVVLQKKSFSLFLSVLLNIIIIIIF